jgi:hypothetical protein
MSEYSVDQGREVKGVKPEQVELLTMEAVEVKSQQKLSPKVLQPTPRTPRTVITILFILFGLGTLVVGLVLPVLPAASQGPCPEPTAFSIDLPLGTLSYNAVKIIDAVWNLAVGRGLQVLAAWVCYKTFGMALLRITQQNQVSVELYSAISFHPLEIKTIPKVIRAAVSKCGWRGRMTFIWFLAAIIYVLILPTILDLMTGYVVTSTAMIPSEAAGGGLIDIPYIGDWNANFRYFSEYGSWIYGPNAVHCVPDNTYQWGFSITWVMVVASVTTVWCWGMFGLWFDAQKNSLLWQSGRRSGLYRDILDVSNALQEALGPDTCAYTNAELTKEVQRMGSVGFEAVSDGSTGYIALRHEPVGCASLRNHDVEYGRRTKGGSSLAVQKIQ